MRDPTELTAAAAVFARYGFRKTSMDDVAMAIGVSRQALYKKHGSKEALFQAVVEELVTQSTQHALTALSDASTPMPDRILAAFDAWAGQFVELLRSSPHSSEILDIATANARDATQAAENELAAALASALGPPKSRADDAAFALLAASKGLLVKARDRDDYLAGMRRVISAVTPRQAATPAG